MVTKTTETKSGAEGNPPVGSPTHAPPGATNREPRLVSLDQFRGYTVAGMFLVNFVGSFTAIKATLPLLCHHNTFCSYADTIMPHFLFAVGFAYRLTFLRRAAKTGAAAAYRHALQRCLGLLLVALVVHHLDGEYKNWNGLRELGWKGFLSTAFQREFFQTLTHIAITSLWITPVIALKTRWRLLFAISSAIAFHLASQFGYYHWEMTRPGIDGGPLGFLGWTIPAIAGSVAYDIVARLDRYCLVRLVSFAVILMAVGYAISCLNLVAAPNQYSAAEGWKGLLVEPPFVPPTRPVNIWTMSQRAGSISYLTFDAGLSVAVYALFVAICDFGRLQLGVFRTLGTNALAGYILHELVNYAIHPFTPKDSPLWYVFAAFGVSFAICYVFLRHLEKQGLFLRL